MPAVIGVGNTLKIVLLGILENVVGVARKHQLQNQEIMDTPDISLAY